RQIFEGEVARPHIDRRGADHRDRLHAVEDAADVVVVVIVVVHSLSGWSFRGDAQHRTRNLEIPGSRFASPGMTTQKLRRHLSCHFGSRFSMKAPMPSSASRAIMFSVITSAA